MYPIVDFVVLCHVQWRIHHVPMEHDMIRYNFTSWIIVDMYSIVMLQELCQSCWVSCYFVLFYFGTKRQNLLYFILLQMGEQLKYTCLTGLPLTWNTWKSPRIQTGPGKCQEYMERWKSGRISGWFGTFTLRWGWTIVPVRCLDESVLGIVLMYCRLFISVSELFKAQWHQMVAFRSVQCHPGLTYIFNFWHSGILSLRTERQSARMSEIKNIA